MTDLMRWLAALLLLFVSEAHAADSLYSASFGNARNPAVVFLHGGPGYNCASFEMGAAQRLADSGYFVVVFDQRGCGRSASMKGEYTLEEAFDDIQTIYSRYNIKKASLIGHSWGGALGTMFAQKYPERVRKLLMTGSPLSFQRTLRNIANRCEAYYRKNDTVQLAVFSKVTQLDSTSLMYSSLLFFHAMRCGLYATQSPSLEGLAIKEKIRQDPRAKLLQDFKQAPIAGLYKTIKYTTLELGPQLTAVSASLPVSGIYGKEDGLFDTLQIDDIGKIIGPKNMKVVINASHSVYLDQPSEFFVSIKQKL